MADCATAVVVIMVLLIVVSIFISIAYHPFGYAFLGIVILIIIIVAVDEAVDYCCGRRKSNRSPISSLLPTSAQQLEQAGDASDDIGVPPALNTNASASSWDHGRGESIVLQPPPPAVMRGPQRDRDSYLSLGGSVTYSESSTLVGAHV
jgi:hypothetical protein